MRSKAPLVLMEQIVMLLVFALAAAICLQSFVKSDQLSAESAARDQAVIVAQNTAELLKGMGSQGHTVSNMRVAYDANWQTTDEAGALYILTASRTETGTPGLAGADIQICRANGKLLFELQVAWQETIAPQQTGGER